MFSVCPADVTEACSHCMRLLSSFISAAALVLVMWKAYEITDHKTNTVAVCKLDGFGTDSERKKLIS